MILPITKNSDSIWKQKFKNVSRVDPEVKKIVADMKDTLEFTGGVGLASPQVGLALRIFIVNYSKLKAVFINPKIVEKTKVTSEGEEGCLSVPGFRGLVHRSTEITIDYLDIKGRPKRAKLSGYYARIIQHEYDHLNSTFYVDRIVAKKKKLVKFAPIRLVFFGTPQFGATILRSIIGQGVVGEYEVLLVITQPVSASKNNKKSKLTPVQRTALEFSIPILQPPKLSDKKLIRTLKNQKPDVFVVASYGRILPKNILNIPKHGSVNIHASLLPKHRGASPIQTALLKGDKQTGITIMLMNEKMDEGDILAKAKIQIGLKDTSAGLNIKLAQLGSELIHQVLHLWVNKRIKPRKQLKAKATYTEKLTKDSGHIDWKKPPKNLERMIRAYYPWPGVWTNYNDKILKFLPERKIQLEGKQSVKLSDFKNGHKDFKIDMD